MLYASTILSVVTFLALWFILIKLPEVVRKLIIGQWLLSDVIATLCVYASFGGGPYALLGAGFTCLWVSLGLLIAKRYHSYTKIKWRITEFLRVPFPVPYFEHVPAEYPLPGWFTFVKRQCSNLMGLIFGRKKECIL